jgi:hypothetical protein
LVVKLSIATPPVVICIDADVAGANVDDSYFIGNIRGGMTAHADTIPVLIETAGPARRGQLLASLQKRNQSDG